jgi:hypothetical protein
MAIQKKSLIGNSPVKKTTVASADASQNPGMTKVSPTRISRTRMAVTKVGTARIAVTHVVASRVKLPNTN